MDTASYDLARTNRENGPEVIVDRPRPRARVSVILLDWNVRESFHSLYYLNNQTVARESYDLVWVEFYDRRPAGLREAVERWGEDGPAVDKWIVLGYDEGVYFHKHRMYNVGILAADGDICVICDSDAMFPPNFIESVVAAFEEDPNLVLHLDEVRNNQKRHYPFDFPDFETVLEPNDCINWNGHTTRGLDDSDDILHEANYGACMCARREDLLAIGGADEHLHYLGYICGPYELTFRLVNHGCTERWLDDVFLVHTWHPGESGINVDYRGPSDGRGIAAPALEARESGRIEPLLENPCIAAARRDEVASLGDRLSLLQSEGEAEWRDVAEKYRTDCEPELVAANHEGFAVYRHACTWYALRRRDGPFDVERFKVGGYHLCLSAHSREELDRVIAAQPTFLKRVKSFATDVNRVRRERGPASATRYLCIRLMRIGARVVAASGRFVHRCYREARFALRLGTRVRRLLGTEDVVQPAATRDDNPAVPAPRETRRAA